ncbi:hypothetical protein [Ferruginibacter sp.]|nr:hypothetical protein [Ferruginibacter sp.]
MKNFKTYDFWISVGLIFSFTILSIIDTPVLFAGYFIVGGWQVISMLVHAYNRCFTNRWGARYIYHWITFIAVITIPGSFWVLLYVAPFMAVYYAYLCYNEVYVKMKRPLDLLK